MILGFNFIWNLALDHYGQPNWPEWMADAPVIVNKTSVEYYKAAKFYVLGQYYKYLSPDSQRIGLSTSVASGDINAV